jgi:TRAP transporter TAXI family solute receptor
MVITDTPSELAEQLLARKIDAIWLGAELPAATFEELSTRVRTRVFGLSDAEIASVLRRFPHMAAYTIAAGSYTGQAQPIRTVAVWNFAVANQNLDPETAYRLVRAVLRQSDQNARALPPTWAPEAVFANTFLPYHPGALRYYQESGTRIPPELVSDPGSTARQ